MVKKKIQRNPQRNIRKLAQEHRVGYGTAREPIREGLQLVLYKYAKGQFVTDQNKASRLKKCKKMKTLSCSDALHRLFTDEKTFTVELHRKTQN
ncbi:hypothetical protein HPB47_000006 [Ixodes persulcatus]|uniref:Uncharacterized protein n=1 Tax=Ixodes persulcatus TaxID=34615 RepID=A0AC60PUE2_IXOPE|nr:hypothetical protein HPB47_000006 [Ixodes persulcatus]